MGPQHKLKPQTDAARWSNPASLETAWDARAEFAAQFVPAGSRVLDLGCGRMALQRFLPLGCDYQPCDLVRRDDRTIECDFNAGEFPADAAADADLIVLLGVLEYISDLDRFFAQIQRSGRPVILSYCPTDLSGDRDRTALGWINHLSLYDLAILFDRFGFVIECSAPVDELQIVMKLQPPDRQMAAPPCTVAVISFNDAGNFGDRLGYHMINAALPSQAVVHHLTFTTLERARDKYDLVVLGIGNSVFQPLLNDKVFEVVGRGKAAVGIFGTQYRELISRPSLDRLIDRMDTWFARYEDDLLLYGRGRSNAVHLGDWLIDQFPMTEATDEKPLLIGDEIWDDLPLDRTIQRIQRHKNVFSPRLHPLLCALTSAELVAYSEQPHERSPDVMSGKFRSMLLDVFGRTYPEKKFFAVDRNAVARYKSRVHRNVARLGEDISKILRNVAVAPA
ncbi:MAG: class I SAM-dependent methyltransferase [Alphaproteobacteria bacterium]|nr:class I SAM-dependent methyltransferase [Alphaproteobacteria bacterium]